MESYYTILDVAPDASQEKIKEQYYFLLHAWHPDKFPSPEQKAKAEIKIREIIEAYETLGNPKKRAAYEETPAQAPQFKATPRQKPTYSADWSFKTPGKTRRAQAQEENKQPRGEEPKPPEEKGRLYWAFESQREEEIKEAEKNYTEDIENFRQVQVELQQKRLQDRMDQKKQRRLLLRRIALACLVVIILAAAYFILRTSII
jgi:curved DNA-binding protein CbpA